MQDNLNSSSDESLVSLAKAGDTASFGVLVERYKERAVRVAFSYVRNFEDARDVAQDAFVKAYGSLNAFGGRSRFFTWLFRIVVNQAIDFARRRRERTVSDTAIFDITADPHESAADTARKEETRVLLERLVDQLPPQQKNAILLTYFNGLTAAEAAEVLNVAEGTVKAAKFQALANLKTVLTADLSGMKEPR